MIRLFSGLIFTFFCWPLCAQLEVSGYEIRRIGVQNGLANQVITTVGQDRDNRLWFGTDDGLYNYDGFRILRVDSNYMELEDQAYNYITDLALELDAGGLIFVCTKGGLRVYDPVPSTVLSHRLTSAWPTAW